MARTRRMIALNDPGLMKVCLQVRGTGRINQDGREAEILPGDLTMYDTSRPYVLSFDHNPRRFETLVFMFPQAMIGLPIDALFALTATRVNGTEGTGSLVAPFFRGIAEGIAQDRLTFNGRLALNAVSLLETVYRERLDQPSGDPERAGASRLVMIQTWLDRRLADPPSRRSSSPRRTTSPCGTCTACSPLTAPACRAGSRNAASQDAAASSRIRHSCGFPWARSPRGGASTTPPPSAVPSALPMG